MREEYDETKLRASEGAKVINNVLGNVEDESFLRAAKETSSAHHGCRNGNGYPNGLSGENIPLSERIMSVADVFDAFVLERVYKTPIPSEEAFSMIESEFGRQFESEVAKAFFDIKPQILAYVRRGAPSAVNALDDRSASD